MFRRRIFGVIIVLLIAIGLLSIGGYLGWSQGYTAGIIAADGEGSGLPFRPFYGFGFFPFFFGFGLFFKFIFFLLLFFLIAKLFGFWAWRRAGGPPGYGWGYPPHGPPPWYKEREGTSEEAKPDTGYDAETKT